MMVMKFCVLFVKVMEDFRDVSELIFPAHLQRLFAMSNYKFCWTGRKSDLGMILFKM